MLLNNEYDDPALLTQTMTHSEALELRDAAYAVGFRDGSAVVSETDPHG